MLQVRVYFMHMRHMFIVLGVATAFILTGATLYYYGPSELREGQQVVNVEASALGADASEVIPFEVIVEGMNAVEVSSRKNYAVYDEQEFARLWRMAMGDESEMPKVDFERDYVIGVFAGEKMSGGYGIKVANVTDNTAVRTVAMTLSKPGTGCVATQALTSPFQIISVPFSDREHARSDTEVEAACQ